MIWRAEALHYGWLGQSACCVRCCAAVGVFFLFRSGSNTSGLAESQSSWKCFHVTPDEQGIFTLRRWRHEALIYLHKTYDVFCLGCPFKPLTAHILPQVYIGGLSNIYMIVNLLIQISTFRWSHTECASIIGQTSGACSVGHLEQKEMSNKQPVDSTPLASSNCCNLTELDDAYKPAATRLLDCVRCLSHKLN
jgi:hypothetical protein